MVGCQTQLATTAQRTLSVSYVSVTAIRRPEQLNIILHKDNQYHNLRLSFGPDSMSQVALQDPARTPTIDNTFALSSLSISSYPRLGELISDLETSKLSPSGEIGTLQLPGPCTFP